MNFCVTCRWRRGQRGVSEGGLTVPAHSVFVTVIRQDPNGPFFSGGSIPAARARGGRWEEAESAQLPQPHSRFGHRKRKEAPASTDGDGKKAQFRWCSHAVRSFKTAPWMWMWQRSVEAASRRRPSIFGRFFFSRAVVAEARPASARQGGGKAAPAPRVGVTGVNASCWE